MPGDEHTRLSVETVQRIIHGATRIDSELDDTITRAELIAIAQELGISGEAMDHALSDAVDARRAPGRVAIRIQQLSKTVFRMSALGVVVGALISLFKDSSAWEAASWIGIAILAVFTLRSAMRLRGRWSHVGFQVANLATWTGFALGAAGAFSFGWVIGDCILLATISAAAGAILQVYRDREKPSTSHTEPSQSQLSRWQRITSTVRAWLVERSSEFEFSVHLPDLPAQRVLRKHAS